MSSFAFASAAWASSWSGPGFITHAQVPSSVEEEWGELGGRMNMVVVLEFGIGEEFVPVVLALVAEEVEILFQLLVYMLHLAIGLRMVGSGGVELYSEQSVELAGLFKLALLWLEVELVPVEAFQDKTSDSTVFLQHFGGDEDVVKVHAHYTLCNKVAEDVVHHGLEGGWAVGAQEIQGKHLAAAEKMLELAQGLLELAKDVSELARVGV
ncbi:hypothetical protein E4T56_gene19020 [Termitomyces sp. T112]|nr:hypothetical protein E4T56_gene19020 [Termitomyces sp. T112]